MLAWLVLALGGFVECLCLGLVAAYALPCSFFRRLTCLSIFGVLVGCPTVAVWESVQGKRAGWARDLANGCALLSIGVAFGSTYLAAVEGDEVIDLDVASWVVHVLPLPPSLGLLLRDPRPRLLPSVAAYAVLVAAWTLAALVVVGEIPTAAYGGVSSAAAGGGVCVAASAFALQATHLSSLRAGS